MEEISPFSFFQVKSTKIKYVDLKVYLNWDILGKLMYGF